MNAKTIAKDIFSNLEPAIGAAMKAFEQEQLAKLEALRVESTALLEAQRLSSQAKIDALAAKLSAATGRSVKAPKISSGKRGAPRGVQSCRIFPTLASKGPRYNYLSQPAHDLFYTGRTAAEAKALVGAVLLARLTDTQHAADPGTEPPEGDTSPRYVAPITQEIAAEATEPTETVERGDDAPIAPMPVPVFAETAWAGDEPSL